MPMTSVKNFPRCKVVLIPWAYYFASTSRP